MPLVVDHTRGTWVKLPPKPKPRKPKVNIGDQREAFCAPLRYFSCQPINTRDKIRILSERVNHPDVDGLHYDGGSGVNRPSPLAAEWERRRGAEMINPEPMMQSRKRERSSKNVDGSVSSASGGDEVQGEGRARASGGNGSSSRRDRDRARVVSAPPVPVPVPTVTEEENVVEVFEEGASEISIPERQRRSHANQHWNIWEEPVKATSKVTPAPPVVAVSVSVRPPHTYIPTSPQRSICAAPTSAAPRSEHRSHRNDNDNDHKSTRSFSPTPSRQSRATSPSSASSATRSKRSPSPASSVASSIPSSIQQPAALPPPQSTSQRPKNRITSQPLPRSKPSTSTSSVSSSTSYQFQSKIFKKGQENHYKNVYSNRAAMKSSGNWSNATSALEF